MMRAAWLSLLLTIGCSDAIIVTVEPRASVHDVAKLLVTLSNNGLSEIEELPAEGISRPTTFSIGPVDRSGEIKIEIDALDELGLLVGRGETTTSVESSRTTVRLDPADFVVNTDYAGSQKLLTGFQLAATPTGSWTVAYTSTRTDGHEMLTRQFDSVGRPIPSNEENALPLTHSAEFFPVPAVAASSDETTNTIWIENSTTDPTVKDKIWCHVLHANGTSSVELIGEETRAGDVSITARASNTFAITWRLAQPNNGQVLPLIRGAVVTPACKHLPGSSSTTIASAASGGPGVSTLAVAANGDLLLYAWGTSATSKVHMRVARQAGDLPQMLGAASELALDSPQSSPYVRIAPLSEGFGVFVQPDSTEFGKILLYRTNKLGVLLAEPPTQVTTHISYSPSFGLAPQAGGAVLVFWSYCSGVDSCSLFGQLVGSTGLLLGTEFPLFTTATGDKSSPSAAALPDGSFAVAWTDSSRERPDQDGSAIRATIIYPPGYRAAAP